MNWIAIVSAICGLCIGTVFGAWWAVGYISVHIQILEHNMKEAAKSSLSWYMDAFRAQELAKTFRAGDIEKWRKDK